MIWIASFPRSGNTYLRNILFEVYGLESSTYHREVAYPVDKNFTGYPFVKTHELPATLEPFGASVPAVYLVRDGRDAICSMAHHRSDLIAPGSEVYSNLREAIVAERGSFFGGWSLHAQLWLERASIIIRYEELVADPIGTTERLRALFNLPQPDISKLPTFEQLKFGIPQYGAGRHQDINDSKKRENAAKFFRRGQIGSWKQELPEDLHDLFWCYHGESMSRLGYTRDGALLDPHLELDHLLRRKLGYPTPAGAQRKYRVLVESGKLISRDNDGVKRYQVELMKGLFPIVDNPDSRWTIDLYINGSIRPLSDFRKILFEESTKRPGEEAIELPQISLFLRFERWLTSSIPRSWVAWLAQREINFFHQTYELVRTVLVAIGARPAVLSAVIREHRQHRGAASRTGIVERYDLLHLPLKHHFAPFRHLDIPILVTIHDLTHLHFPEHHTATNIANSQQGLNFVIDRGARVIAVSQATRRALLDLTPIPEHRINVVYEAADPALFSPRHNQDDCKRVRRKYGLDFDNPYIICLSTLEPRKNLENSIKAFMRWVDEDPHVSLRMVIAGKSGWHSGKIHAAAADYRTHIYFTGFVEDQDLAYLYSDALALSYVSLGEGFGLPPLEAMRCGTPVIYGNNSSLIEVVGEGGLPANPLDIEDIKNQYKRIFYQSGLREQKSRLALHQAIKFSWRDTALNTLALYENIIDGPV